MIDHVPSRVRLSFAKPFAEIQRRNFFRLNYVRVFIWTLCKPNVSSLYLFQTLYMFNVYSRKTLAGTINASRSPP